MQDTTTQDRTYVTPRARIIIQGERITELELIGRVVTYAHADSGMSFEKVDGRWVALRDGDDWVGCECEQDWSCPLHAGQPTWIETRYSEMDLDPRERSF